MRGWAPVIAVLTAVVVWRSGNTAKNTIFTRSKFPVGYYAYGDFDESCYVAHANEMKFCEDETFWELKDASGQVQERRIIVGCDQNRHKWNTVMGPLLDPNPHGSLFIYNPSDGKSSVPQRISLSGYPDGHDFHPLGMEIYPSFAGNSSNLFVVNHARARTVIEQFVLSPSEPTRAQWIRTITSPNFVTPNSLALTSPTSFFVTNDHLLSRRLPGIIGRTLPLVESVLALPFSWVAHVSLDEDSGAISHSFSKFGIPFANGVALSPDGTHVAVASTSSAQINIYSRSSENALTFLHSVEVPYCPDNLAYDEHGTLIVAGHPNFPDLVALAANKSTYAPSWVVSIEPRVLDGKVIPPQVHDDLKAPVPVSTRVSPSKSHQVTTLFQSDGSGFSSSSTGLVDSITGKLFITGLYETGLLVCENPLVPN